MSLRLDLDCRLPALADDLVRRRVNVIATGSATLAVLVAKAATRTIPIVFLSGADPVKEGFVDSLNRPGGNLTGVTTLNVEIAPKRLEVLHELLPTTTIIAVLVNLDNYQGVVASQSSNAQAAAHTLGLQTVHVLQASTELDLNIAFAQAQDRWQRRCVSLPPRHTADLGRRPSEAREAQHCLWRHADSITADTAQHQRAS